MSRPPGRRPITTEWRAMRREAAEKRNALWAAKPPKEQLADLDRRGLRAKKQRAKLLKKINRPLEGKHR